MFYEIALKDKTYGQDGEWHYYQESFLPGFIPDRVIDWIKAEHVRKTFGWCGKECQLDTTAHPLDENGEHYCTLLLHDTVNPKWKLKDLI